MNKVILIGRLGKDPEVKQTANSKVCAIGLATNDREKDKDGNWIKVTDWHNLVLWGKYAEVLGKYGIKGTEISVEGKSKTRRYTDRNGVERDITEIIVSGLELLSGTRKVENGSSAEDQSLNNREPGDDLPF